jgi:hypothetical protein
MDNEKLSAVLRELHPAIGNTFKDHYSRGVHLYSVLVTR